MNTDESQAPGSIAGLCWQEARRRPLEFEVVFAQEKVLIDTLEGPVYANAGDAVIAGVRGEFWPVPAAKFSGLYEPVPPTRMGVNGRYRRQAGAVRTSRLMHPLSLRLTDGRGVLSGKAGDWLIKHPDGALGIVADQIFQQTYELMT